MPSQTNLRVRHAASVRSGASQRTLKHYNGFVGREPGFVKSVVDFGWADRRQFRCVMERGSHFSILHRDEFEQTEPVRSTHNRLETKERAC